MIILNFDGFGIILDMDWLKRYVAIVNCKRFEVEIGNVEGRTMVICCLPEDGVLVSFLYLHVIPWDGFSSVPIIQ